MQECNRTEEKWKVQVDQLHKEMERGKKMKIEEEMTTNDLKIEIISFFEEKDGADSILQKDGCIDENLENEIEEVILNSSTSQNVELKKNIISEDINNYKMSMDEITEALSRITFRREEE